MGLPPCSGVAGARCPVIDKGNEHEQRSAEQYRREQEAPARAGEHHEQRIRAGGRMQRASQLHERDGGADSEGEAPRVDAERREGSETDERAQHVAADEAAGLREGALRHREGDDAGGAERRHEQRGVRELAEGAAKQDGEEAADPGEEAGQTLGSGRGGFCDGCNFCDFCDFRYRWRSAR